MSENRAKRLMMALGDTHDTKHLTKDEDDGTLSQMGPAPDRPLDKYKRDKKVVGSNKKNVFECRACHYGGISEDAKICPECGVRQMNHEDWSKRVKNTRRTLVEGKDSWVEETAHLLMAILEFADPSPYNISEDGTAQEELRGRVTDALLGFSEWQESHHNHQLASNGDNNE